MSFDMTLPPPPEAAVSLIRSLSNIGPPPPAPAGLKRQTSDVIGETYKNAIENCDLGRIEACEGLLDRHHYKKQDGAAAEGDQPTALKAVVKELKKDLPKDLDLSARASMFIRYDEDRPQFLQALLTGVQGTPYESGCFLFDVYVPANYPQTNPSVTHTTKNATQVHANNGPGGFSPNLHQSSGKVCLSLLGTWNGPGWEPGKSNLYQVLASILWMILGAEHPYYMEPGHGGWEGTAPKDNHSAKVVEYDEEVKFGTAKWGILEQLKEPPRGFEGVVRAHFAAKRPLILATTKAWFEAGSKAFQERFKPVLEELEDPALWVNCGLVTVADARKELELAKEVEAFVVTKIAYLEEKVALAGGGAQAKLRVPKAWARLRAGPASLKFARKQVADKEKLVAMVEERAVKLEAAASAPQGAGL